MAIITLSEVKTFLQISGTTKDALITALIPEIQGDIVEECNNTFLDSEGAEAWPAGIKVVAAMMIGEAMASMSGGGQSIGLKSESQGGYSYTKDSSGGGYADSTLNRLKKWKIARVGYGRTENVYRDRRGFSERLLAKGFSFYGTPGTYYESSDNPMIIDVEDLE